MTVKRPCLDCPRLTTDTRCGECRRRRRRETYGHPAYRALPRPTGKCQLRIKCNGAPATSLDHIDGDNRNHHPSNIAPACGACNSSKGNRIGY